MKPRSLRVRLLLSAAVAVFLALAAAWLVMTFVFGRHIERRVQADLVREGMQLAANLTIGPDGRPLLSREPGEVRFGEPASGLYWQLTTRAGSLRSRSLWDQALPASPVVRAREWNHRSASGPFEEQLLLVERVIRPDRDGPEVLIQLAIENKSLYKARREFGAELALFLLLLWVILSAASWTQVALGLKPLARVRDALDALKRSPGARLPEDFDASALLTVRSSWPSDTGFSMKSSAPSRVASTAVSTVACPDIMTTGPSEPESAHSLSREMPSVSGIQMSSSVRSKLLLRRASRARAASSAVVTSYPSSLRISCRSSRIFASSSTTRILAVFTRAFSYAGPDEPSPRPARRR